MNRRVWMITGASRGLGMHLTEAAAKKGEIVVAVFRDASLATEFTHAMDGAGLGIVFDVRRDDEIAQGVELAISRFGRIDVLVNNAGIGAMGAVEELSVDVFRDQLEVNFLGALRVIRAVLPSMRARRSGLILQMSSVSGFQALPGLGAYSASKFALEGLSEALSGELRPLGVQVCLLEPGPFRTEWIAGADTPILHEIEDYASSAHRQMAALRALDGKQPGDPAKAADFIVQLSRLERLPMRLPIGQIAIDRISAKIEELRGDIELWRALSSATAYA